MMPLFVNQEDRYNELGSDPNSRIAGDSISELMRQYADQGQSSSRDLPNPIQRVANGIGSVIGGVGDTINFVAQGVENPFGAAKTFAQNPLQGIVNIAQHTPTGIAVNALNAMVQ